MKRAFIFFVFTIFILSSCSQTNLISGKIHSIKMNYPLNKATVPLDFIPSNLTIVSAGDSLTQGVGDSRKRGGYIPYLKAELEGEKGINKVNFMNYGVKGNKTGDLLKRLKSIELQKAIKSSDMVILTIGGNDIMKVVKENISHLEKKDFQSAKIQYEKNLIQIMNSIRDMHENVSIVLIGLYNPFHTWFADVKEMDEILFEWNIIGEKVISSYDQTYFVKIDEIFKNSTENLLYKDYFHPNDKGYSYIANRLYKSLSDKAIDDLALKRYLASKEEN
ncbi:SGNH/GDSL hydrolase family protein [Bacillus sp. CGMCC 1.16607]|uniref:SGNH/GDSL hydrolase family protein n=1 Tax=Bacillus sp. CGMCC 1.16607 TaxID=3351842 RepID=UPI00362F1A67